MDKPSSPRLVPNLITSFKSKDYPEKAKGISFFAFVVSIFIYISIFYIFNLSPSKLFHNNKFWFFISNTLVFIIAVDYSAFSSSKHDKHDLQEEHQMRRQHSFNIPAKSRPEITKKKFLAEDKPEDLFLDAPKFSSHRQKGKTPEKRLSSVPEKWVSIVPESSQRDQTPGTSKSFQAERPDDRARSNERDRYKDEAVLPKKKAIAAKTLQRSKSDVIKRVVFDESRNIIRRVDTARREPLDDIGEDDNEQANEYANMSNEELNRRVEEFIQRFNRQIRLQRETDS